MKKHPVSAKRSNEWPKVRKAHIAKFPCCAVCGGKVKVEVHHIKPFHIHPELELDPANLLTLCEGKKTVVCHLVFGHFGNYIHKYNENIKTEAVEWYKRLTSKT